MEQEEHFLFVIYTEEPLAVVLDDKGREVRDYHIVIKRATVRKHLSERDRSRRINIDFDPLSSQTAYLVGVNTYSEHPSEVRKSIFKPTHVVLSEDDANKISKNLEKGEWRSFSEKKEKFQSVIVSPILITTK